MSGIKLWSEVEHFLFSEARAHDVIMSVIKIKLEMIVREYWLAS